MSDSETSPNLNSNTNEERPTPQFGYCEDGQIEKADSEGTNCSEHFLQRLIRFFKKESEEEKSEEEESEEKESEEEESEEKESEEEESEEKESEQEESEE